MYFYELYTVHMYSTKVNSHGLKRTLTTAQVRMCGHLLTLPLSLSMDKTTHTVLKRSTLQGRTRESRTYSIIVLLFFIDSGPGDKTPVQETWVRRLETEDLGNVRQETWDRRCEREDVRQEKGYRYRRCDRWIWAATRSGHLVKIDAAKEK